MIDSWKPLWTLTFKPIFESVGALKTFLCREGLLNPDEEGRATQKSYDLGYVKIDENQTEVWNLVSMQRFMGFASRKDLKVLRKGLGEKKNGKQKRHLPKSTK